MEFYIYLYSFVFFFIFINIKLNKYSNNILIILISFFYSLLIGFRFDVGGDWLNYQYMYNNIFLLRDSYNSIVNLDIKNFLINFNQTNLGFDIFTSISRVLKIGLPGLNFLNAILFVTGLYIFLKNKKNNLLIILIALPILIIIVGMGYTRQASALGLLFIAIKLLENGKIKNSIFFVILAFSFHKTAIFFAIIYIFYFKKINLFLLIFILFTSAALYYLYFGNQINHIIYYYLGPGNDFISIGAIPRTSLFLISSIIFFIKPENFVTNNNELKLYSSISLLIIFLFPLVLVFSTALDRMLIYFFSLQLLVFSQLDSFFKSYKNKYVINICISIFFFLILLTWLIFGKYSNHWIPYNNFLLL